VELFSSTFKGDTSAPAIGSESISSIYVTKFTKPFSPAIIANSHKSIKPYQKMPEQPVSERVIRGTSNSPLPPSVEAAYYRKCIELKRRVEEIESNNDKYRSAINRHASAIKRLRGERAFLIDTIVRETGTKPATGNSNQPASDDSESIPPTVGLPNPPSQPN